MAIFYNNKFEICKTFMEDDFQYAIFPIDRIKTATMFQIEDKGESILVDGEHVFLKEEYHYCMIFETNLIIYEGLWKNDDLVYGVGYEDNSDYYKGFFKSFQYHGVGTYFRLNYSKTHGHWRDNVLQGSITIEYEDGSTFEGIWDFETGSGKGTYRWEDGDIYQGEYRNNVRNGRGYYKNKLGESYDGEWSNNHCSGYGESYDKDGNFYKGEWRNNMMHGKGQFVYVDGRRYNGCFRNDVKNGYGVYKWTDGDVYKGKWKNGKRDGKGLKIKGNVTKEMYFQNNKKISEKIVSLETKNKRKF